MKKKKQLSLSQITAKKIKKANWIYRHSNNLQERILILKLLEFYYRSKAH